MCDAPSSDVWGETTGVEAVAVRTGRRIDDVCRSIQRVILRDIGELGGDQFLVDILGNSVAANVQTVINALRYGIEGSNFEVPAIATEYARRLAQRNVPLEALVRAYRLGQTEFLRIALDEVLAIHMDAQASLMVAQQMMAKTAEYIDWVTERVIRAYSLERDHWLMQRNMLRTRHIRRILAGKDPENTSLDAAIGLPLLLRHIAVVAWLDADDADTDAYAQVELELRRLREYLPVNGEPLLMPADQATIWAWFPLFSDTTAENVAAAFNSLAGTGTRPIYYAVGTIESDGHGFRVSHARAQVVRNVILASGMGTRVGNFSDPRMSVTSLFAGDMDLARDWVSFVLGPLAEDDLETARLRETLEAFLTTGSNYTMAAEKLHVHPNTIKYRIHKARDKLRVRTNDGRIDIALALALCSQFGGAVLTVNGT
jgi:DNA-binding PucR family transcriptional regulator